MSAKRQSMEDIGELVKTFISTPCSYKRNLHKNYVPKLDRKILYASTCCYTNVSLVSS